MKRARSALLIAATALLLVTAVLWRRSGSSQDQLWWNRRDDVSWLIYSDSGRIAFMNSHMTQPELTPAEQVALGEWRHSETPLGLHLHSVVDPVRRATLPPNDFLGFGAARQTYRSGGGWVYPRMMSPEAWTEHHLWSVAVPYWAMVAILVSPVATRLGFAWLQRGRRTPGLCPLCGYDLRASPRRCPECGRASTA